MAEVMRIDSKLPPVIVPNWPAPAAVQALVTTRSGGVSQAPYASLNLAAHVGDDPHAVAANRRRLRAGFGLPAEPLWLNQVHGCEVARCDTAGPDARADAAFADGPERVCAVLTADCLPVLLCNRAGTAVAAAHAGWRGLAGGVLEATLGLFEDRPASLMAWLGPAIGREAFEVGDEVRQAFVERRPADAAAFRPPRPGHALPRSGRWLADLHRLAYNRLSDRGVGFIGGGDLCTYADAERFYSYRRDRDTGRMASLIWIEQPEQA